MVCEIRKKIYDLEGKRHPHAQHLYRILPDLVSLKDKNFSQISKIRRALNDLHVLTSGTKHDAMVCSVISIVKKIGASKCPKSETSDQKYRHAVTDHALCMFLERHAGIDTLKLKDQILTKIDTEIHEYVFRNGHIITILPKGTHT